MKNKTISFVAAQTYKIFIIAISVAFVISFEKYTSLNIKTIYFYSLLLNYLVEFSIGLIHKNVKDKTQKWFPYFSISLLLLGIIDYILFSNLAKISLFHYFDSIIISKILVFLLQVSIYKRFSFAKKYLLPYPFPLLSSVKWKLTLIVGRIFQWGDTLDKSGSNFTQKLLNNTTYFFRDFDQISIKIMNNEATYNTKIQILCLGCSTGEEPVSIAIFCADKNIEYEITAIDLSQNAIKNAKNGVYKINFNETSIDNTLQDKASMSSLKKYESYFDIYGDHSVYKVSDSILRNIKYFVNDITKIEFENKFDLIVCRNMLHYLPSHKRIIAINNIKKAIKINSDRESFVINNLTKKEKYLLNQNV